MNAKQLPKAIEFNRPAKYQMRERLGEGACGETVLIYDESMDCNFVVKKYKPYFPQSQSPADFAMLLARFNDEARLLFRLNHPNVVRVYSYYDYKEHNTAYIVMEYVDGLSIVDFAHQNPSMLGSIFEKIIDGFVHLESQNILHRDIRPLNILVDRSGNPKIIDFGFGKSLQNVSEDVDKSISLNWWCEIPPEFSRSIYDFQTEVYFVGKLFEQIIKDEEVSGFKYLKVVARMCEQNRDRRYSSFSQIKGDVSAGQFEDLSFSHEETRVYREFANALCYIISSVDPSAKYERDHEKIIASLDGIYRRSMLEENVSSPNRIVSTFLSGAFRFWKQRDFETEKLKDFLQILRSLPNDKQAIVLENLVTRLDGIEKTKPKIQMDDDIPF